MRGHGPLTSPACVLPVQAARTLQGDRKARPTAGRISAERAITKRDTPSDIVYEART
jgi:hypothetical protein